MQHESTATGAEPKTANVTAAWGPARRLLFRLLFAYLVLYNLPFPLQFLPYGAAIARPYQELWNKAVPWVGEKVFRVTITVLPNGSGDTTYNYVQVFCFLFLAVAATAVWTALDWKRSDYALLHQWLRVYIRFALAAWMVTYGAVKVIKSQFPDPSLGRLVQPFGEASPMGLLWTFMGASEGYNVFTGAGEMLGGLLLTTRRTTLLGALVCLGVVGHVVVLNFCYDVPVKLFSCHLLLMAAFLAAPDLPRLANLFLLGRGVAAAEIRPAFRRKGLNRGALALRTLLVAGFVGLSLYGAQQSRKTYGDLAPKPPLFGIWNVEDFEADGKVLPPLTTDAVRWRRVIVGYRGSVAVQLMDDSRRAYPVTVKPDQNTLELKRYDDPNWQATLTYREPEPERLTLQGVFDGRAIRVKLRRVDESKFQLVSRGFHWISEYPFNR
jgi:hypothetical protein